MSEAIHRNLASKLVAEFLGACAIVLVGCGAVMSDRLSGGGLGVAGIAAVFGLVVLAMVYALGHISGAHFNPAVTVAFALTRHFPASQVLPYIVAQALGALCASLIHAMALAPVLERVVPGAGVVFGTTQPVDGRFMTALVWEFVLSFFLMLVIMGVATDYRAVGKAAGLAIGATVWFEALFAGPICGASMNPARSFGPACISGEWSHFGAYVLGPVAGAIAAAYLYRVIACLPPSNNDKARGCC